MKNLKIKLATGLSIAMLGLGMLCPTYSQQTQTPLTTITEQIIKQETQTISGKICKFEGERELKADEKTGTILTGVGIELKDGTEMRCYAPKNYKEEGSFYRFYETAKRYAEKHDSLVEATITGYPLTEKNFKESKCDKYDKNKKGLIMKILEVGEEKFKFD